MDTNREAISSPMGESWDTYRKKHYSSEEIIENDLIAELVGEIINARKEQHIPQRDLEAVSGIRQ